MPAAALADGFVTIAVAAAALALVFVAPGGVLLFAARVRLHPSEAPACWFAASLVLLTAAFGVCLALSTSIAAAPFVLAAVTATAALAARFGPRSAAAGPPAASRTPQPDAARRRDRSWRGTAVAMAVLAAFSACAAVAFAPVGSVDRWWYLAYVRGWLEAPVLDLAEPFLGTGQAFARFGVHPWLFGIAVGSWFSGVDPIAVYERGAPIVVVIASVSAAHALAREVFGDGARVRLTVLATMLLWSGALVPVLARAGEDKILAASALLPLVLAAFLRMLRGTSHGGLLLAIAAAATAAVHALDYALALLVLVPASAVLAVVQPPLRRRLAAALVVLAVVAIAPAISGIVVRERLAGIGADLSEPDHPVVRVHEARERLVDLGAGGYVVQPRLLLHPLVPLAMLGAFLLLRPRSTSRPPLATDEARLVLLVATVVPLAVAFVPPLPAITGSLIPPWMVYRVLWVLPFAPLAAAAAFSMLRRLPAPEPWAAALVLSLGLPALAVGTVGRLSDGRGRLATPRSEEFRAFVAALRELPADAVVAAPPALAERIPALCGRRVLAALDRSTIVFAGSRTSGEARLRARAAVLSGDAKAGEHARDAGVRASHAVYDPAAAVRPRCSGESFRSGRYALCTLDGPVRDASPRSAITALPATLGATRIVAQGRCLPEQATERVDPWSAAPPLVVCTIDVPSVRGALALRLAVRTGRATDELLVTVRAGGDELHGTARVEGHAAATFAMPRFEDDALEVRIASAFLPSLRVERVEVVEYLQASAR